jgi:hypothetical protein
VVDIKKGKASAVNSRIRSRDKRDIFEVSISLEKHAISLIPAK